MNLLALDTSSDACSVALQVDEQTSVEHVVRPRDHSRILIPMIRRVLAEAGAELAELDAIVLGNGPGSFIGMRIATSVAQGLAYGSGLKIVPVSSLAAVAGEVVAQRGAVRVAVAQDARMNEVYLGVYDADDSGLPVAVAADAIEPIARLDTRVATGAAALIAAGQAWHRIPALYDLNRDAISERADVIHPNAKFLLGLGARGLSRGEAVEPERLKPAYLRTRVAERPAKPVTEL